jgi:hypothetical protein
MGGLTTGARRFRLSGLDPAPFCHLFGLDAEELARHGVERHVVTQTPGFPDRVELRDGAVGETMLLLNFEHQPAATPYRARHAIFVREGATAAALFEDIVPEVIRIRPISLRAFDAAGRMVDAELADGVVLEPIIAAMFERPEIAYLHAHYAKRGCFAARIDRP